MQGVYAIVNTATGRKYIGSSNNIEHRYKGHVYDLRSGRHHCSYLQRSWNRHGESVFKVLVIESISDGAKLRIREQEYLAVATGIYNSTRFVKTPLLGRKMTADAKDNLRVKNTGKRASEETRKKMSLSRIGHAVSDKTREKLRMSHVGRIYKTGIIKSRRTCELISQGLRGKKLTTEHRKKLSDAKKGKLRGPYSAEHRRNISIGQRGRKPPQFSQEAIETISRKMREIWKKRKAEAQSGIC